MFDATENFWILPNFILRMSPVVKNVSFELNFWHESKCWLCKMSSFAGQDFKSNSWFQAKFSTRLKISGFCQISSFVGLEWSKIYFLSQIFNTNQNFSGFCQISSFAGSEWSTLSFFSQIFSVTENFWILPNFILCMSRVVKTLNFGLDFDCDWKFLNFATFHPLHVPSGQKCQFWVKFLTRIKISWFCKISSFAGQEWSKSRLQAKFSMRLKISGFCHISSFAGLEWSKIWFLNQIFNTNQNFSGFCQILSFAGSEWATLSFLSQVFNTTENFWILPNFILCMSRVVKLLILGLILIAIENFWILPHFILYMSRVVKNVCF